MRLRLFLLLLTVVAIAAVAFYSFTPPLRLPRPSGTLTSQQTGRPNVVLVSLDTTRPDHLGCYGYPRKTSPNLDCLAREGVRFANARSQAPWTLPSHMSLFTSLLPSHCGIEEFSPVLAPEVPTLAQVLQAHGYHTAAFVNDLQMKAHWGFSRGFGLWREFTEGTAEGKCEHITAQAVKWLDARPGEPFFLFLHYYDPHDPYDPPPRFRQAFGSSLSGAQASRLMHRSQRPGTPAPEPGLLAEVVGSYDGEIAWLDGELGKLFQCLPENTLTVVFSDHGEAFKEHGWALHGPTLYEEEIRTVLLMHQPGVLPAKEVKQPVMLLDVAPSILSLCGVPAPTHYEGSDLSPLWHGDSLPDRLTLAETKAPLQGRALKAAVLGDWKLIYSVLDGCRELYKLPDEHADHSAKEPQLAQSLGEFVRDWVAQEDYLLLYARGNGEFAANLTLPRAGQFLNVIPTEHDPRRESYEVGPNGRWVQWTCHPGGKVKGLYVQVVPSEAPVQLDLKIEGARPEGKVFGGVAGKPVRSIPLLLSGNDNLYDVEVGSVSQADREGFFVLRHRGKGRRTFPAHAGTLDEKTIQQLRSLGYLR